MQLHSNTGINVNDYHACIGQKFLKKIQPQVNMLRLLVVGD